MFGYHRRKRIIEVPEITELGPVRVQTTDADSEVGRLAREYADFGGAVQALLRPDANSKRILATLRYGAHTVEAGALPEAAVSDALFDQLTRLSRRGNTFATDAEIVRSDSGYQVWLNPAQSDEVFVPQAFRSA